MKSAAHLAMISLLVLGLATTADAAKKKAVPLSTVKFLVVRDENGKPIRDAAVVLHPVNDNGKQERSGYELKTDPEGKTGYDGVPYGKLRIQVLAHGFQTYGYDYDINQPDMDITIKMKRPAGQYSIYQEHPAENTNTNKDQKPPDDNTKPQ
jgi:hypothetical protein